MSNNIVSANFTNSKPSYTSSKLTVANNIVNVNLNDTDIKTNGQNAVNVDMLSNVELTESEYSLEELLADAENQREEAQATLDMVENQVKEKDKKVAENFYVQIQGLDMKNETDCKRIETIFYSLSPNQKQEVMEMNQEFFNELNKAAYEHYKKRKEKEEEAIKNSYSKLTDKQRLVLIRKITAFTTRENFFGKNPSEYYGKTIKEIKNSITNNDSKEILNSLITNGLGEYELVEICNEDDFDAVVLRDTLGNYIIHFPGTDETETGDLAADALAVVGAGEYCDQVDAARKLTNKYYDLASEERVRINLSGHSLGGHLAEQSYLQIKNYMDFDYNFGNLVLFNAYHGALSVEEAETIARSQDSKIYATQGDDVSTIGSYEVITQNTKYLKFDSNKDKDSPHSVQSIENYQFDENGMLLAASPETGFFGPVVNAMYCLFDHGYFFDIMK